MTDFCKHCGQPIYYNTDLKLWYHSKNYGRRCFSSPDATPGGLATRPNPYKVGHFWFWYDERSQIHGPFTTEEIALVELLKYAEWLEERRQQIKHQEELEND